MLFRSLLTCGTVHASFLIEYEDPQYGRLSLGQQIGVGTTGPVFEADFMNDRGGWVGSSALKCRSGDNAPALNHEFDILKRLQDEDWAPKAYSAFDSSSFRCLIMQLVGESITVRMAKATGLVPLPFIMMIGSKMVDSIETLHKKYGVVHGDVEPGNWLLSDGGSVYLADFGNAYTISSTESSASLGKMRDLRGIVETIIFVLTKSADPSSLQSLFEYIWSFDVENTPSFPEDIYSRLRDSLAAAGADQRFRSVKERELELGAVVLKSPVGIYYVIDRIHFEERRESSLYLVDAEYRVPTTQPKRLVVKCGRKEEIIEEYKFAKSCAGWCPVVYEQVPHTRKLSCFAMEYLAGSLSGIPDMTVHEVFSIGLKMLEITQEMHEKYSLNHRDSLLAHWMLRWNNNIDSMAVTGLHALRALDKDPHGYHRILELQQLVLNLRTLVDPDLKYDVRKSCKEELDARMAVAAVHPILIELQQYVFSVNPQRGTLPPDMYSRMRDLMLDGLYSDESETPDWMRSIPPRKRKTILQIPDPNQVRLQRRFLGGLLGDVIGMGGTGLVFSAKLDDGTDIAVKCRGYVDNESAFLAELDGKMWAPKLLGMFELQYHEPSLKCMQFERMQSNLESYMSTLTEVPLVQYTAGDMWKIVRELHTTAGIVHGDIQPSNWLVGYDARLVLADYSNSARVTDDLDGTARLREIRQMVQTLWFLANGTDGTCTTLEDMNNNTGRCPAFLKEMIVYVLSVNPAGPVAIDEVNERIDGFIFTREA